MNEVCVKIAIPNSWTPPLYRLGQRVKQGEIIGLEYHPPGTQRAYEFGQGWSYTVLLDDYSAEVDIYKERQIELPTDSESHSCVQELINQHQIRITALTEQMELLKGNSNRKTAPPCCNFCYL
ncbi:MAG: hypothetical protein V7K40_06230 [Nostoc sp.]|uniref:hypothetical protein n=1 Tax=Nostoc sp. TaxID=1180 RepID=UPI002FF51014